MNMPRILTQVRLTKENSNVENKPRGTIIKHRYTRNTFQSKTHSHIISMIESTLGTFVRRTSPVSSSSDGNSMRCVTLAGGGGGTGSCHGRTIGGSGALAAMRASTGASAAGGIHYTGTSNTC